jgi:hypothetical protein
MVRKWYLKPKGFYGNFFGSSLLYSATYVFQSQIAKEDLLIMAISNKKLLLRKL